ncbi:MAG: patatin-like phospholipase family protein, partial [Bacteroidetes bacterium]|nr:patatin-like phospholipase family protein [Bacteroidota bacterium]
YLKAASMHAVFSHNILDEAFEHLLPGVRFSDLKIPFACVATDIRTGNEVILKDGRVLPAVVASSSIPGFVEPARVARHVLVDGSTTSTVPVAAARELFRGRVIAVDVSMDLKRDERLDTAFEIAIRAGEITSHYLTERQLTLADFVVHPEVGRTNWANFDKLDEMISAGEIAVSRLIPRLYARN